jgi:hypothetical protein
MFRGPFLTSPLTPRGELGPHGWNLSPRGNVHPFVHPPGVISLYCLEEWRGKQRISPPGDNSPLGDNFASGGQS